MAVLSQRHLDEFLEATRRNGAPNNTVRALRSDLAGLLEFYVGSPGAQSDRLIPAAAFDATAAEYLTAARPHVAPATLRRRLATFRAFARHQGRHNILPDYRSPKLGKPEPHPLPEGIAGVARMLTFCTESQERAVVALCGLCGLRVSEACAVVPNDFNLNIMTLTVRGKGDKTRVIPVSDEAWMQLAWPHRTATLMSRTLVGWQQRFARQVIRRIGVASLGHPVASHDLRATFATAAYEKTKDLRTVQELMGHADSKTTEVYTGVSMEAMRKAANVL